MKGKSSKLPRRIVRHPTTDCTPGKQCARDVQKRKKVGKQSITQTPLEESTKREIRERFSKYESNFGSHFIKHGEKTITEIQNELEERIFLLLLIIDNDGVERALTPLIPDVRARVEEALLSVTRSVNICLTEHAQKNRSATAAAGIWENAVMLVSRLKELAISDPNILKPKARKELYFPSLRAKPVKFTDDFPEIADAIELSKNFLVKTGNEAQYVLDSLVTQFVVKLLKEVDEKRRLLTQLASMIKTWPEPISARTEKIHRFIQEQFGFDAYNSPYVDLPAYNKKTAKLWWDKCVKSILKEPETLQKLEGTKLYRLISAGAKTRADYDVRDYFKKLCGGKVLKSLAP